MIPIITSQDKTEKRLTPFKREQGAFLCNINLN